jgi:hypothetical protein
MKRVQHAEVGTASPNLTKAAENTHVLAENTCVLEGIRSAQDWTRAPSEFGKRLAV